MKKTTKKVKLSKLDKFLIFIITVLAISSPVVIVYSKSELSQSNIELERLKRKISTQEDKNESISMKINSLGSLPTVNGIAKEQGLSFQNDNIVIVK